MHIVEFFNYLVVNMINVLIVRRFYHTFLHIEVNKIKFYNGLYFIFYAITTGIFILFQQSLINLITYITGLLLMSLFYNGNIKKKVFASLVIYAIFICSDVIINTFVKLYCKVAIETCPQSTVVYLTVSCLLNYLIVDFLCRKHNFYMYENIAENDHIIMAIIPASLIYLNAEIGISTVNLDLVITISIISLITIMILFYFLEKLALQTANQKAQDNQTKESEAIIKRMKHDMLKELKLIQFFMSNERVECAQKKLIEHVGVLNSIDQTIKTGHEELDFILNMKRNEAKEFDIKFDCRLNTSMQLRTNYKDISMLIWNLLDNAIEACVNVESEKWIKILLDYQHGTLLIKISNSYNKVHLKVNNNSIETSKKDKLIHGNGLKIIRGIVKDYNGEIDIQTLDSQFEVTILLLV